MKIGQLSKFSFYLNGDYTEFLEITKWIDENKILSDSDTIWWDKYNGRQKKNITPNVDYAFVGANIMFFDTSDSLRFKLRWA
jgi:hypothetical protein